MWGICSDSEDDTEERTDATAVLVLIEESAVHVMFSRLSSKQASIIMYCSWKAGIAECKT